MQIDWATVDQEPETKLDVKGWGYVWKLDSPSILHRFVVCQNVVFLLWQTRRVTPLSNRKPPPLGGVQGTPQVSAHVQRTVEVSEILVEIICPLDCGTG